MPSPGKQVIDRLIISDVPAYILSKTGVNRGKWTVHYWTMHGKRSYSNRIIKLRFERIMRQKFTRKSWVDTFLTELEL